MITSRRIAHFLITLLALILTAAFAFQQLTTPVFVPGKNYPIDPTKPSIIITHISGNFGGIESHVFELYKLLVKHGYPVTALLIGRYEGFTQKLNAEGLSYYTIPNVFTFSRYCRSLCYFLAEKSLQTICTERNAKIIQANNYSDAIPASRVAQHLGIKAVFTHHEPSASTNNAAKPKYSIKGLDAVICVSPVPLNDYAIARNTLKQSTNITRFIPPLFRMNTCESFKPITANRIQYFKDNFGISLNNDPVVTMVANFYADPLHKNHGLLIDAINILIHQKKIPVQVMLAGGAATAGCKHRFLDMQQRVHNYKLDKNIHFLGFVENAPEIMHHSNIVVLSSAREGLPLVLMEAGLLGRPVIGASDTGTAIIIDHEKTGLIFKNNDVNDLALQLERLIQDPVWAQQLGRNGREHVLQKFHPARSFEQYEEVYAQLMRSNS